MIKLEAQQGWQCPQCKAIMSPWQPTCFHCKPASTYVGRSSDGSSISYPPGKCSCQIKSINPDGVCGVCGRVQ